MWKHSQCSRRWAYKQKLLSWWKKIKDEYINAVLNNVDSDKRQYILHPGQVFGSFYKLTNNKWVPTEVIALENAQAITFSSRLLDHTIKVCGINQETVSITQSADIIQFLYDHIPNFNTLGKYKNRLVASLNQRVRYKFRNSALARHYSLKALHARQHIWLSKATAKLYPPRAL